jgi:hypothetical protein
MLHHLWPLARGPLVDALPVLLLIVAAIIAGVLVAWPPARLATRFVWGVLLVVVAAVLARLNLRKDA